jgi:AAHS family 4-hydroxybenzoate transporter-like MFS transporter
VARPVSRPWWLPHVFGSVPPVPRRDLTLVGIVSLALFFEAYDLSMSTSALKDIARDLAIPETALGGTLAVMRLGALPAFLLAPLADRVGRRRVFLASVAAASLGTFATAFTTSAAAFVAVQMLTRTMLALGSSVAVVIVAEEFPALYRGWALGVMGALSSCGHGLGALLFALIERLPGGWRSLYAFGLVPLLLWPRFRRTVPETGRFTRHAARAGFARAGAAAWLQPLVSLCVAHPARAGAIALVAGLLGVGEVATFQFTSYFVQTAHAWTPPEYSAMVLGAGGVGIIGNVVAGRLADRLGRRRVGAAFLAAFPIFAWVFYNGSGRALPVAFAGFVFCDTAGVVILRAFSAELFPTSHRGTSAGLASMVQTLGWATGLSIVGAGTHAPGDLARMTSLLSVTVLAAGLVLLALPETHGRELEALSAEGPA